MISTGRSTENHYGLEVLRDGHIIYTHGYGGSGPLLECVELFGHHLEGSHVRTVEVDLTCGRLMAFAGVRSVEVPTSWTDCSMRRGPSSLCVRAPTRRMV